MTHAFEQAMYEVLSFMLNESGLDYVPGVGMSIRVLTDDAFEVFVGGVAIGTFSRTAMLEVADAIRKERT